MNGVGVCLPCSGLTASPGCTSCLSPLMLCVWVESVAEKINGWTRWHHDAVNHVWLASFSVCAHTDSSSLTSPWLRCWLCAGKQRRRVAAHFCLTVKTSCSQVLPLDLSIHHYDKTAFFCSVNWSQPTQRAWWPSARVKHSELKKCDEFINKREFADCASPLFFSAMRQ